MSDGIETDEVARWIHERLTGDATITALVADRVTGDDYPEEWANPLIQFTLASNRDVLGVGGVRVLSDSIWEIKAIDEGSTHQRTRPIATRIEELFGNTSATTAYGNFTSVRERGVRYPEVSAGVRAVHLGGMYRVRAST